jgi:Tfp pilus assembly ATPase PilU
MITLDSHLMALYQAGRIHYEDLITKAQDPDTIVEKLKEMGGKKK